MFKKYRFNVNSDYKLPYGWDGKTSHRILKIIDKVLL